MGSDRIMKFIVISNKETYEYNEYSVFGEIYIQIGKHIFPAKGWNDIVSSVLDMWVSNLTHLIESDLCGQEDFDFMDGPFLYKIEGKGSDTVALSLYENDKLIPDSIYNVSFQEILTAILKLINELIDDKRYGNIYDVKNLSKRILQLKKTIKKRHLNIG